MLLNVISVTHDTMRDAQRQEIRVLPDMVSCDQVGDLAGAASKVLRCSAA